jgi:hypothetical protein
MTARPVGRWISGKSCSYAPENPPDISTISCAGSWSSSSLLVWPAASPSNPRNLWWSGGVARWAGKLLWFDDEILRR